MTVRYTPGQLRDAAALSPETYRHWKKALAPLRRNTRQSPCFTAGDLLAVAVVRSMTRAFIRVGALSVIAEELFRLCSDTSWPVLERSRMIVDLVNQRIELQPESEDVDIDSPALVCPLRPLVGQLRDALLTDGEPDQQRLFAASTIESALLIARDPRPPAHAGVTVRSTEVADHDRISFLKIGPTTTERRIERAVGNPPGGDLWIPPLPDLWRYLESAPRLSDCFSVHQGIQRKSSQSDAWSTEPRVGYRRGLHNARRARQFMWQEPIFLDCRKEGLRRAIDLPWDRSKLIVNAARLSGSSWRIAAMLDRNGLVCSQQFFGLWPNQHLTDAQFLTFAAVLNGPVASAFLATHSPAKRIRIAAIKQVPIPSTLPFQVEKLVAEYVRRLQASTVSNAAEEQMQNILTLIDAAVLEAYDLPARLEHELLEFFRGSDRPVAHPWRHWDEQNPASGLTLAERVSGRFRPHGSWILDVFQPLPADEAELLRTFGA